MPDDEQQRPLPAVARKPGALALTSSELTAEHLVLICAEIARAGDIRSAAALVGTHPRHIRKAMRENEEFKEMIEDAWRDYSDCTLFNAAHTRAVEGVEKPVYDKKGERVGTERVYSDRLLMRLLEVHDHRFRPHSVTERKQPVPEIDVEQLSPEARELLERFLMQREEDDRKKKTRTPDFEVRPPKELEGDE